MPLKRSFMKAESIHSSDLSYGYYQDGRPDVFFQMSSTKAWDDYFKSPCESLLNAERELFMPTWYNGHFGPYDLVQNGSSEPLPSYRVDLPEITVNNAASMHRMKVTPGSIEIVVAPFARGYFTISQGYGSLDEQRIPYSGVTQYPSIGGSSSKLGASSGVPAGTYKFRGLNWTDDAIAKIYYARYEGTYDISPGSVGFNFDSLQDFMSDLVTKRSVSDALVTKTLADANRGTVDMLTSIAEMPEFLRSVLQGCRTIVRMYGEAKRKEFRLLNKAKTIRLELARLKPDANFNDIKTQERYSKMRRTLLKQLEEVTSAIADVWLNWRLNIYPTAMTVEDTLKGLKQLDSKFLRFRDRLDGPIEPPQFEGWSSSGTFNVTERCFIKRGAQSGDMFNQVFTSSLPSTAWELLPFSFIIDRYVDIGSWIASFSPRNSKVTEGATYSWKYEGTVTYTHNQSNATITVDLSYYKRVVIDPNSMSCIPIPSSRSWAQSMDHLALAWNILLKNTLRKYA
ncbi:MAG: maturation protein [Sanya levivirus 2]|nr:MAG: maturation protein [Sanya levivirus 2]